MLLNLVEDTIDKDEKGSDLRIESVVYDPTSMRAKFIRNTPALLTPVRDGSAREESEVVLLLGLVMLEMITGGIPSQVLARVEGRGIRNVNTEYSPCSTMTGLLPSPAAGTDDGSLYGGYSPHRSPVNENGIVAVYPENPQRSSTKEYLDHLVLNDCPLALEALTFQCLDRLPGNRPSLDLLVSELRDLYQGMTADSVHTNTIELATVFSSDETSEQGRAEQDSSLSDGSCKEGVEMEVEKEDDSSFIFFQNTFDNEEIAPQQEQLEGLLLHCAPLSVDPDTSPIMEDYVEGNVVDDYKLSSTTQFMSPATGPTHFRDIDPRRRFLSAPAAPLSTLKRHRSTLDQEGSPSNSDRSTQTNAELYPDQCKGKHSSTLFSPEKDALPLPHRAAPTSIHDAIAPSPIRIGFSGPFRALASQPRVSAIISVQFYLSVLQDKKEVPLRKKRNEFQSWPNSRSGCNTSAER